MDNALFYPGTVVFEIKSKDKDSAIKEIISRSKVFDDISDKKEFEKAVFTREKLSCTGVGHGIAFAHGKIAEITTIKTALGISRQGIDYGSADGKPVHLLFVVATNPSMHLDYLKRLSILARMARTKNFREEILACFRQEEVENKLTRIYSLCEQKVV